MHRREHCSNLLLWIDPRETPKYAGVGLAIGFFVGCWVTDRQRTLPAE